MFFRFIQKILNVKYSYFEGFLVNSEKHKYVCGKKQKSLLYKSILPFFSLGLKIKDMSTYLFLVYFVREPPPKLNADWYMYTNGNQIHHHLHFHGFQHTVIHR